MKLLDLLRVRNLEYPVLDYIPLPWNSWIATIPLVLLLNSMNHSLHTGIFCQNFFHYTIIPLWRVSWVTSSRNYNLFVWSAVFQPKWNASQKTYKNYQNPVKSYCYFRIFSEFVQFWLENSGPNQLDELNRRYAWNWCNVNPNKITKWDQLWFRGFVSIILNLFLSNENPEKKIFEKKFKN